MGVRLVLTGVLAGALLAVMGCSERRERGAFFDSGSRDAGGLDASGPDGGGLDAGGTDAGGIDSGSTDAGFDAGAADAGTSDAGDPDAGADDAGAPDAGCIPSGSAGPRSPTGASNDATVGSRAWTNVTDVFASDSGSTSTSNRAYVSAMINSEVSNYLLTQGYGFAIPSGATIDGITLEIERRALSGVGLVDDMVTLVKDGIILTADRSVSGTWTSTEGYVSYGGPTDLWGTTWTPADINAATFGSALSVLYDNTAGNDWPLVDHVRITVRFTNTCP